MKKIDHYFLMLDLFGEEILPKFDEQQYIDKKPTWYSFSEKTKMITGKEMENKLE